MADVSFHNFILCGQILSGMCLTLNWNNNGTSEICQAEKMVLHEANVCNHHIKKIFTNCFDITAQLQLLAIQQHHTNLPLHILHLTTFLVGRQNEKEVISCLHMKHHAKIMKEVQSQHQFPSSPLLNTEQRGQHRAHWPSSQIQGHESSAIRGEKDRLLFYRNFTYKIIFCVFFLFLPDMVTYDLLLHIIGQMYVDQEFPKATGQVMIVDTLPCYHVGVKKSHQKSNIPSLQLKMPLFYFL